VYSFVFHSSLLTAKSVDLVVHMMGSLCNENCPYFLIVATSITEVLFKQFLIRTAV